MISEELTESFMEKALEFLKRETLWSWEYFFSNLINTGVGNRIRKPSKRGNCRILEESNSPQ